MIAAMFLCAAGLTMAGKISAKNRDLVDDMLRDSKECLRQLKAADTIEVEAVVVEEEEPALEAV